MIVPYYVLIDVNQGVRFEDTIVLSMHNKNYSTRLHSSFAPSCLVSTTLVDEIFRNNVNALVVIREYHTPLLVCLGNQLNLDILFR